MGQGASSVDDGVTFAVEFQTLSGEVKLTGKPSTLGWMLMEARRILRQEGLVTLTGAGTGQFGNVYITISLDDPTRMPDMAVFAQVEAQIVNSPPMHVGGWEMRNMPSRIKFVITVAGTEEQMTKYGEFAKDLLTTDASLRFFDVNSITTLVRLPVDSSSDPY